MPKVIKGYPGLILDSEAILQKPHLAAMISAIAIRWTDVENSLAYLFVDLLDKEDQAALTIYLELIDYTVRRAAFNAVARSKLDKASLEAFDALFKKVRKSARERNKIVHGLWRVSKDHDDGLILIDPADMHTDHFRFMHMKFKGTFEALDHINKNLENMIATKYTREDFQEILDRISNLFEELEAFRTELHVRRREEQAEGERQRNSDA